MLKAEGNTAIQRERGEACLGLSCLPGRPVEGSASCFCRAPRGEAAAHVSGKRSPNLGSNHNRFPSRKLLSSPSAKQRPESQAQFHRYSLQVLS